MPVIRLICLSAILVVLSLALAGCGQSPPASQEPGPQIDMEISSSPIHEVKVNLLKSNPPQIDVYIKGGLQDGCTAFHNIEVERKGSTINLKVTNQHPVGVSCPAIYTYFEENVNLGSDFTIGTTYTLNVNDYTTTFSY